VSRYPEGTQDTTEPALNASDIVGRAVATIVESSVDTRMHRERLQKTATTFLKGRRFVWSVSEITSAALPLDACSGPVGSISIVLVVLVWLAGVAVSMPLTSDSSIPCSCSREQVCISLSFPGIAGVAV